MKPIFIILLAAASAVCFAQLPKTGTDAAKLLPAQTLVFSAADGEIRVESDTGASGSGKTLAAALEQMERSAEGTLFLGTAEYLVLTKGTQALLADLYEEPRLRPAAKPVLCGAETISAEQADAILQAHPTQLTLAQAYAVALRGEPVQLHMLRPVQEGGWLLVE